MGNCANETYYRASEEINKIRKKKGITVKDFAEAFGKNYSNTNSALYRSTKLFSEEELDDISAYLGVPKSRLMVNPTGFIHGRRNNFESLFLLKAPATNRKELAKEEDKPMTLEINTGNTKFYEEVKPTDAMQEILDAEKAEYEEIRDNYRNLKAENESLKAEAELCNRLKNEAQEDVKKLQSLVEALKKGNEQACNKVKVAEKETAELRTQNDKISYVCKDLKAEIEALQEKCKDYFAKIEMLSEANGNLKRENETLKADLYDLLYDFYKKNR